MQRIGRSFLALGTIAAACAIAWQWSSTSVHTLRRAAPIAAKIPLETKPPTIMAAVAPAETAEPKSLSIGAAADQSEAPKATSEDPPKPVGPRLLPREELLLRVAERRELSARWTAEAKSSDWTAEANQKIRELLGRAGLNVDAVAETDCRQTICRFNLGGTDGANAVELIRVARQLHDETWIDHKQQRDGTWRIEVFFSKKGYRLSGGGGPIGDEE